MRAAGLMRFKNKVVIVTGGSSGIGRTCVGLRWHEGAFVHNLDLIRPAFNTNKNGEQEFWMEADLGDEKVPDRAIQQVLSSRGRIDVLINNAAFTAHREGALLKTDRNEWHKQFDINATGTFSMSQACLPPMIEQQGGTMVNMGSIGELSPFASTVAYCIAKAAILQLTRSIAIDYGRRGIRCKAACPGAVDTLAFGSIKENSYELANREARTALGRIGRPEEIASAVTFLASSDSSYISRATLVVDGGWSITQWSDRLGPRGRCRGTSIRQLEPCVRGKRNNLRMKTQ